MSQLEDALGQLMQNPQLMQQLQTLAQSMGNSQPREDSAPPSPSLPMPDPASLQKIAALASHSGVDREQRALLNALGPYISRERAAKLERAMRAAGMAMAASAFLRGR